MLELLAQVPPANEPWQIELSATIVMFVTGAVLPLVVGLVTKITAHPALKGFILITLDTIAALVTHAIVNEGVSVISKQAVLLAFIGWVTAVATYFGFWKPVGAPTVLAPTVGIGPASPHDRRV